MDFSLRSVRKALIYKINKAEKGSNSNFASSPLCNAAFFTMLVSGFEDEYLERLLHVLNYKSKAQAIEDALEIWKFAANKVSSNDVGPLLSFAYSVWYDERYYLKHDFENALTQVFRVDANGRDFFNKGDEVADEVNSWVNDFTHGLIPKLFKSKVRQDRLIILASAIYFKGIWEVPFEKAMTTEDKFFLLNGTSVEASYMRKWDHYFLYGSFDDFQLLKLPYETGNSGRTFYMYIFLPHEKNGLKKLIRNTKDPNFFTREFQMHGENISELKIPKFKLCNKFQVPENLNLDAGKLLKSRDPQGGVPFRDLSIFQRAVIIVDEDGTEATAVETDEDLGCSLNYSPPPPLNFVADHPFMFMIKEEKSDIPFFIGAVLDPSNEDRGDTDYADNYEDDDED